ncbi:MAG TPA: type IV pilus twitching motility protein PilT [Gammaproteobacteria bacterium]|nr:type IV pilus twitching motility protein PilT [Gammaproteobacteria bacterium]
MSRVNAFLELLIKQAGSDLHLVSGNPPRIRLYGEIHPVKYRELTENETRSLLFEIMPERVKQTFESLGGADFGYEIPGISRFRVNVFRHLGGIGAVFRAIPSAVTNLDDLSMPPVLKTLARQRKGLILVSGPTGSGKSTTLAAMIDFINSERKGHIITIEDPVEHVHMHKGCLISQREVGDHTDSFASALRSALREDPDVILVGEMRDLDTISLAVTAAEMGILILATLHTNGAAAAIDRIINVFPPGEEPYIRAMLSTSLCGVISQQLVKTADNRGRLAAVETLINNSAASNIIREGKTEQLESVIQGGALQGMQNIDTALRRLLDEKLITGEEAYRKARLKSNFEQYREQDESTNPTSGSKLQ